MEFEDQICDQVTMQPFFSCGKQKTWLVSCLAAFLPYPGCSDLQECLAWVSSGPSAHSAPLSQMMKMGFNPRPDITCISLSFQAWNTFIPNITWTCLLKTCKCVWDEYLTRISLYPEAAVLEMDLRIRLDVQSRVDSLLSGNTAGATAWEGPHMTGIINCLHTFGYSAYFFMINGHWVMEPCKV